MRETAVLSTCLVIMGMISALFPDDSTPPDTHLSNVESSARSPQPAIITPCEIVEWYDGDTATVRLSLDIRVRLLDCWSPEVKTTDLEEKKRGIASRDYVRSRYPAGSDATLEIPLRGERLDDVLTLGRVLGRIWVNGRDVSSDQVESGYATREKGGQ